MTYTLPQYLTHLHKAGPDQLMETAARDLNDDQLAKLGQHIASWRRETRAAAKARRTAR